MSNKVNGIVEVIFPGTPMNLDGKYLIIFGCNGMYDISTNTYIMNITPDMSKKDIQKSALTSNEIFSILKI